MMIERCSKDLVTGTRYTQSKKEAIESENGIFLEVWEDAVVREGKGREGAIYLCFAFLDEDHNNATYHIDVLRQNSRG